MYQAPPRCLGDATVKPAVTGWCLYTALKAPLVTFKGIYWQKKKMLISINGRSGSACEVAATLCHRVIYGSPERGSARGLVMCTLTSQLVEVGEEIRHQKTGLNIRVASPKRRLLRREKCLTRVTLKWGRVIKPASLIAGHRYPKLTWQRGQGHNAVQYFIHV